MDSQQISRIAASILLCAGVALANTSNAQLVSLSHGGSTLDVELSGANAGANSWTVDTIAANHLNKQWFQFRVGSGGFAAPINTIGAVSYSNPDSQTLEATYANAQFSLTISYSLTGGGLGSGNADIGETISVLNTSGAPLDFHLFQYSDFNLLGTPSGDNVIIGSGYDSVIQWDGLTGIAETVASPAANRAEAALAFTTLNNLATVPGYNLNNNVGPLSGDVTWSFQWDSLIQDGQSLDVFKDKQMSIAPVPEPTAVSILAVALGAVGFLRRRR
jgi:hypothetical protein